MTRSVCQCRELNLYNVAMRLSQVLDKEHVEFLLD